MIRVENLHKRFDRELFAGLSFTLAPGEILGIFGASGIGKSTLLGILSGTIPPDQGILELPERLPMVFQDFDQLLPWYTAKKNILCIRETEDPTYFDMIIKATKLEEHLHKYPTQLSGGLIQRVAIARALYSASETILFDEPFGSLDQDLRIQLQDMLLEIRASFGTAMLFVSHDPAEITRLADRVLWLKQTPELLERAEFINAYRPGIVSDIASDTHGISR